VGQQEVTLPGVAHAPNVNAELGKQGIVGIKTGNIPQVGAVYLAAATAQLAGGRNVMLFAAVQGPPTLANAFADAEALLASHGIPFVRSVIPPRSFFVSAARSSGLITSNSSETDSTPGNGRRCSLTWVSKLERSGQPATVSAIVTAMLPSATRTSRTMSSSVTGRFSSGSMTLPSASVICSREGCSMQRA